MPFYKKHFSLIEILVVVAIIGILASVGVVAYQGYTASAKVSATKANHANLVKWLAAEMTKCDLGQPLRWKSSTTRFRNIDCSRTNVNTFSVYLVQHLQFENWKNPHKGEEPAVYRSGSYPPEQQVGRTNVVGSRSRQGATIISEFVIRTRYDKGRHSTRTPVQLEGRVQCAC